MHMHMHMQCICFERNASSGWTWFIMREGIVCWEITPKKKKGKKKKKKRREVG